MSPREARRHLRGAGAVLVPLVLLAGACSGAGTGEESPVAAPSEAPASSETPAPPPVKVVTRAGDNPRAVSLDADVRVLARHGELRSVRVTSAAGRLAGRLRDGVWHASGRLEPGTAYRVRSVAVGEDGQPRRTSSRFRTDDLTLDEQTYPSVAPLQGETVGVGMPVIVSFDIPVRDRAAFEEHMHVRSTPRQPGAWHWLSGTEAHWRPRSYWRPGTEVSVDVDVNSVPAGGGIYGQESRTVDFRIGDAVVSKVDVAAHRMNVFVNGRLARQMPISAGKAGWETRSGTKVIIEKHRRKTMDAATLGVDEGDPEYYNIANVEYALRVTYSGEFLHAAPWSVGSQGSANVSHGCVGMSTEDARWLYSLTKRGDVVEVTGTDRWMTPYNGYGDWNLPFAEYREGSALS